MSHNILFVNFNMERNLNLLLFLRNGYLEEQIGAVEMFRHLHDNLTLKYTVSALITLLEYNSTLNSQCYMVQCILILPAAIKF